MRFGRALMMGLAQSLQEREQKQEQQRALMQQYNLLTLKQRADLFTEQLKQQYAMQQIQQRAFEERKTELDKVKTKQAEEERYWESPEGHAKIDYWRQRSAAEEARARSYRQEKKSSEESDQKRLRADVAYLDERIRSLQVKSADANGDQRMNVAPGSEAEYRRLVQMREDRLRKLGMSQDSLQFGPPAPAGLGGGAAVGASTGGSGGAAGGGYGQGMQPASYENGQRFGPEAPTNWGEPVEEVTVEGERMAAAGAGGAGATEDPLGLRGLKFDENVDWGY